MALYGLYHKEKSERVFKLTNIVPDDPLDRVEANSPVVARVNFIRKLKTTFKQFQQLYSVRKIATLDSLDIKQKDNVLLAAALEEATIVESYEDRSKIRTEDARRRSEGTATELVTKNFNPHMMYDPETSNGIMVNTYEDHLKYNELGYTHNKPVVKRIPDETTTVTITPKTKEETSRDEELEEKRVKNRDDNRDKFRTKEEQRKRVEEKKNAFTEGTRFGPKKRINSTISTVSPNRQEEVEEIDVVEEVTTETVVEDPGTITYPSSGGGGVFGGGSGGGGGGGGGY
tara:strand:+ start:1206 stop:2066 length:861 start_codon:yes stop_codon:yes gene_type:complete